MELFRQNGSSILGGAGDFFYSMTITLALDPIQPLLFGGPEAVPLRLKQLECETGRSSWPFS